MKIRVYQILGVVRYQSDIPKTGHDIPNAGLDNMSNISRRTGNIPNVGIRHTSWRSNIPNVVIDKMLCGIIYQMLGLVKQQMAAVVIWHMRGFGICRLRDDIPNSGRGNMPHSGLRSMPTA